MVVPSSRPAKTFADALLRLPRKEAAVPHRLFTAADLHSVGVTKRRIRAAVELGGVLSVRRGVYVRAGEPADVLEAARAGGRLACVSVLKPLGVFVLKDDRPHLHFVRGVSKHSPSARTQTWHWSPLV